MAYELRFARDAEKDLARLAKTDARRILAKLREVAADPRNAAGVKKLVDREGYRVRAGDWRAVFTLDHAAAVMTVVGVDNRDSIYRR